MGFLKSFGKTIGKIALIVAMPGAVAGYEYQKQKELAKVLKDFDEAINTLFKQLAALDESDGWSEILVFVRNVIVDCLAKRKTRDKILSEANPNERARTCCEMALGATAAEALQHIAHAKNVDINLLKGALTIQLSLCDILDKHLLSNGVIGMEEHVMRLIFDITCTRMPLVSLKLGVLNESSIEKVFEKEIDVVFSDEDDEVSHVCKMLCEENKVSYYELKKKMLRPAEANTGTSATKAANSNIDGNGVMCATPQRAEQQVDSARLLPGSDRQRIDDGIDSDNCAGQNEDTVETTTSDQPQSPKDENATVEKNAANLGCLALLCVICLIVIIGGIISQFEGELPKDSSDTFGITTSENKPMVLANQKQREEEEERLQQKASAEQQKRQMVEVAQAAKEAGAETYAVSEWEQGNVARKLGDNKFDAGAYEEAEKAYSEAENHFKMATELAMSNAGVRKQKARMMDASQAAKEAGAETYAVSEWEQGNVARKLGDNKFDAGAYEEAEKAYSEAENHFKVATELAVSNDEVRKRKKRMMDASQAAKEAGAKEYAVREWNKGVAAWNHGDDMAKAETYELAKASYSEAENNFNAAELAASKVEAKKMLDVLPSLEARAADLIRDNERWFKWSLDEEALVAMMDELCAVYKRYTALAKKGFVKDSSEEIEKLKSLIFQCDELVTKAKKGKKQDAVVKPDYDTDYIKALSSPIPMYKCSKCNGTGYRLKKKRIKGKSVFAPDYSSDNECGACGGTGDARNYGRKLW